MAWIFCRQWRHWSRLVSLVSRQHGGWCRMLMVWTAKRKLYIWDRYDFKDRHNNTVQRPHDWNSTFDILRDWSFPYCLSETTRSQTNPSCFREQQTEVCWWVLHICYCTKVHVEWKERRFVSCFAMLCRVGSRRVVSGPVGSGRVVLGLVSGRVASRRVLCCADTRQNNAATQHALSCCFGSIFVMWFYSVSYVVISRGLVWYCRNDLRCHVKQRNEATTVVTCYELVRVSYVISPKMCTCSITKLLVCLLVCLFACLFVCLFVSEISEKSRFSDSSRSYYALQRYEMDLLKDFQTNWFEVAIWFDLKTKHGAPFLLSRDHSLESFPANSSSDVRHTKIRRSPGYSNSEKGVISLSVPS